MSKTMITKQDVVAAYALILRREPESEAAIEHWLERCTHPEELINGVLGSKEFELSIYKRALPASSAPLSSDELAASFGVYPEVRLITWLRNLPLIEGMVLPSSAYISAALAQTQSRNGYGGNIAEIGVYHGKYLAGLATSLQAHEKAIAIDVFDDQDLNDDATAYAEAGLSVAMSSLTQDAFVKNMSIYCPDAEVLILKRSSLHVSPEDIMPNGETIRFFSVDGGHTQDVLLNDLRLAQATLAPHGIVSIDDILSDEWPGVITGTVRYFDGPTKLRPVAFIANKLLCAFEPFVESYREALLKIAPRSIHRRNVEFSNFTADQYIDGDDLYAFLQSLPL